MTNFKVEALHWGNVYFDWSSDQGFGQLDFHFDLETEQIHIANECMTRETVRKILIEFANYVADKGILQDQPFKDTSNE